MRRQDELYEKYLTEEEPTDEGLKKGLLSSPSKSSDKAIKDVSKYVRSILSKMSHSSGDTLLIGSLICFLMGMISGDNTYISMGNKMKSMSSKKQQGDKDKDNEEE